MNIDVIEHWYKADLGSKGMIVLFTDFGLNGPYLGQVKNILYRQAPGVPIIDLFANAPTYDPRAAAYLLVAYVDEFSKGTVFFSVVDPGVGGERAPGVLEADGRWYVGPGNGIFELIIRRAKEKPRWWEIQWRPERLSETFHGRDLFAPVSARLAIGEKPAGNEDFSEHPVDQVRRPDWPDDLAEIIYIDDFGNAMTGLRVAAVPEGSEIAVSGRVIPKARKFSDASPGDPLWYENANGLLEFSVNRGRADVLLNLNPGSQVVVRKM